MHWRFWGSRGAGKITPSVQMELVSRFHISPQDVDRMRYLERDGWHGKKRVKQIKIFDPAVAAKNGLQSIRKYDDLTGHNAAILFEGYIEENGTVYLADRRLPRVVTRVKAVPVKRVRNTGIG